MKKMNMLFMDVVKDAEGRFWFFDRKAQMICYMYEDFNRVYPMRSLKEDVDIKNFAARNVYRDGECIYVTSMNSIQILVYDICANRFQYLQGKKFETGEAYSSVKFGNKVFYFPYDISKTTYFFDVSTAEFVKLEWLREEDKDIGRVEYIYEKNGCAYLPIVGTNCLIHLDLKELEYDRIYFKKDICLNSVLVEENGIWLTQRNTETIIFCDEAECEYYEFAEQGKSKEKAYLDIISVGSKIVSLARNVNYIGVVDKKNRTVERIMVPKNVWENKQAFSLFAGYYVEGEKISLFPWGQEMLCELDFSVGKFEGHNIEMNMVDYYERIVSWSIQERAERDLRNLIELVEDMGK